MTSLKDKFWMFYIIDKIDEKLHVVDSLTKLEKLIFFCSKRLFGKSDTLQSIEFERGFYGPRDPGASYDIETNLMLGIFEKETSDSDIGIRFKITEKGRKFINGIKNLLSLEPDYETSKKEIDEELEDSSTKKLYQILQDRRVKEAKKKFLKERV